jgi:hypothetical protein
MNTLSINKLAHKQIETASANNAENLFIVATIDLKKYQDNRIVIYKTTVYPKNHETQEITTDELEQLIATLKKIHAIDKVAIYLEINLGHPSEIIISELTRKHLNLKHDDRTLFTETTELLNHEECQVLAPNQIILSSQIFPHMKKNLLSQMTHTSTSKFISKDSLASLDTLDSSSHSSPNSTRLAEEVKPEKSRRSFFFCCSVNNIAVRSNDEKQKFNGPI